MSKTRWFSVMTGAALSGVLTLAPTPVRAVVPETAWLPGGSQLVLRVRYSDLGGSALFRRLMRSKPMFKEELAHVDRFVAAAGIDPARDLTSALIATDGRERGESVAVLAGRLSSAELAARMEKHGASSEKNGAATVYALGGRPGGRPAGGTGTVVAIRPDGTLLVGTRAWVALASERIEGRGPGAMSSLMMGALLRKLDDTATIWTAAGSAALARQIETQMEDGALDANSFDSIRNLVASFRIANDIQIDSLAATANGDDAQLLQMTVRGLITLGGLRASGSDPALAETLRGLRVDRTNDGIRLTGRIPGSIAERM